MAQVPYTGAPQQAYQDIPEPEMHPNVPAAAFGGTVAAAISGFGKQLEGSGDELFARAMHMQAQTNAADARNTAAEYSIEVGKLAAQYNIQEGKTPAETMEAYGNALKELKEQYKGRLSTTDAKRMFDSEALGTMTHAIVNGASHAASALKDYQTKSYDATITSANRNIANNPANPDTVKYETDRALKAQRDKDKEVHGIDPKDQISINNQQFVKSAALSTQIDSLVDNDLEARRVFKENMKDLVPSDRDRLDKQTKIGVTNTLTGDGVKQLIDENTDSEGKLKITEQELYKKAQALAKPYLDDDPQLSGKMDRAVKTALYTDHAMRKSEIAGAHETLYDLMLRDRTFNQATKEDPDGALAYKTLPNKAKEALKEKFERRAAAADKTYNDAVMKQLDGMAHNENTMHEILEIDPTSKELNLSKSNMDTVYRLQREVRSNMGKSQKLNTYLKLMEDGYSNVLNPLGLMDRTNKVQYDTYAGTVHAAVEAWREQTGSKTYPTGVQFNKEIAPILGRQVAKPGFFAGILGQKDTGFEAILPQGMGYDAYRKLKGEESIKKGEPIDEKQIQRDFMREKFKGILELRKKAGDPAGK